MRLSALSKPDIFRYRDCTHIEKPSCRQVSVTRDSSRVQLTERVETLILTMGRNRPIKSKPKRSPAAKAPEAPSTSSPSVDAHNHDHNHSHSVSEDSSKPYQGACPSPGPITLANATGFIYKELSDGYVEQFLEAEMDEELEENVRASRADGLGSTLARWFRDVADREALKPGAERLLAWKKGADYDPGNIFIRQSDTGRMLCMGLGPCRIRVYGTRHELAKWDDTEKLKSAGMGAATAMILVAPLMAVRFVKFLLVRPLQLEFELFYPALMLECSST